MDQPLFDRNGRKINTSSGWSVFQSVLLFCLIASFVPVTVVLFNRTNTSFSQSNEQNTQIELLQSEVMELMLTSSNATLVVNGTCKICSSTTLNCPTLMSGTIPILLYEYAFGAIFFRVLEVHPFDPVILPVGGGYGQFRFRDCNIPELIDGQQELSGGSVFTATGKIFTPQQKVAMPLDPELGQPRFNSLYFTYSISQPGEERQFQFHAGFTSYVPGSPFTLNSPLRIPAGSFSVNI